MPRLSQFRKASLPLWGSFLVAILLTGGITLFSLWCQPNAFRGVVAFFRTQPLLIVLNALPVGLLLLACSFLLRNVFWGAALTNLAVCTLSIANRIKIEVRNEPVFPRDLALIKEVNSAMDNFDIQFPSGIITLAILITIGLAVLGLFIQSQPFPIARLRGWLGQILGTVISLAVLVVLIFTVYASVPLYSSFPVANPYYVPAVFNDLGFPYCFCHQFTTYPVDKPEGYDRAVAESWETGEQPGQGKDVHLIMIMNEAFSDVSDDPALNYTEENDPLPTIHALRKDPHAIAGHLVVPSFAGGTANTEFDVMTGMQTNAISATITSSMRAVNRNLDSIFRVFGADGYHTSYVHPGNPWFYNRENVLPWLGAEEVVFCPDMEEPEMKGSWVTDDYMADYIETMFESAVDDGQWLCNYTTTIQNHMAYTPDKYGDGYVYPPVPLTKEVSPEVESLLQVYIEGARDADAMLGRLVDYFSQREEPVVLAFWGDHLPYLGDNMLAYRELDSDVARPDETRQDPFSPYETPFIIWANDPAAETLDWETTVNGLDLPENGKLSAAFMGATLLDLTGRREESPWFAFLNDLRRTAPAVQKQDLMLSDGTFLRSDEASSQLTQDIAKWRQWSYYKLRYKEIP